MRILLVGDYRENTGPQNVNKEIIRHKSTRFSHVRVENKIYKFVDTAIKLPFSNVLVVSAPSRLGIYAMKAARMLGKKTVYIMHGCAEYEAKFNGKVLSDRDKRWERELLEYADLLLPVSRKYSQWVKQHYPEYADKTRYWQLGIVECSSERTNAGSGNSVAAAGGDLGLKNNLSVSNAVEKLNGTAKLTVYGPVRCETKSNTNTYTQWAGTVDHDTFLGKLRKTAVFVVNSTVESFNISVMEALSCGCSVLVSSNVGAADLLDLTDHDIIFDTQDESEIAQKILYLMEHPNNQRICSKIDWNNLGYDKAVARLETICEELAGKG